MSATLEPTDDHATLEAIRAEIARMSPNERIHVEAIASTLRNVLKAGGADAQIALALVGAELAADDG